MTHDTPEMRCNCTPVCDTRFGGQSDRSVCVAIVEAVAAAEGVAPTELPPLADDIDLEALETLVTSGDTTIRTSVHGWNVFVRSDGAIRVCDPSASAEAEPVFQRETEC